MGYASAFKWMKSLRTNAPYAGVASLAHQTIMGKGQATKYQKGRRRSTSGSKYKKNVIKQQANRSTRKTKGKKKVKSIVHKRKSVYVSPKLRKKIKKVIDGSGHKGTYHTVRQGSIGFAVRTTGQTTVEYRVGAAGGYANQTLVTKLPDVLGTNTRCWWAGAYISFDGLDTGNDFQFFTPMKYIDAASILWNQKVAANDYTTQTGNLNTVHNETTGAVVVGSSTDMNIKGLKIHIKNSYVKWIVKNNNQRAMTINMYKCVPKVKFPTTTALQTFVDSCEAEGDATNSALVSIVGPLTTAQDDLVCMPGIEPSSFPSFNAQWKYEKVKIRLGPGETTTLFCQGPKNYTLDFDKLHDGTADSAHLMFKQTSMNVMFSIIPDLEYATATVPTTGSTGRWIQNLTATNSLVLPVSIQYEEVFNLMMPDIVGFQTGGDAIGGEMATLNKRLNRRAYGNFVDVHTAAANPTYSSFQEENPAAGITGLANRFL